MRGVIRIPAAVLAAVFGLNVGCFAQRLEDAREPSRLFFAGTDVWRSGAFTHGGLLWSPNGLDQPGFTFKLLLAGGIDDYISGALGGARVTGQHVFGATLFGWRFKHEALAVTVFVGPEFERTWLDRSDPGNSRRGSRGGVLAAVEFWYQPTPEIMVAAHGAVATTSDYSVRAAFGWRAFNQFFIGPEAQIFGYDDYQQYRFGVHVTGLRAGPFEWSAGLGWTNDSDDRNGAYGRLGLIARQ